MIQVRKRNGTLAPCDYDRINQVVINAANGLTGVSVSEVISKAKLQIVDGMTTERIQEVLIKAAEQLITPEEPNYQYVASRLQMYDVRKRAYGEYYPPTFKEHCENMVSLGIYDKEILDHTDEEFKQYEEWIDHKRDKNFGYAAAGQLVDKYLLRDRTKHRGFYESPQMMYMSIAVTLCSRYNRPDLVKTFYDGASTFKFSLPTPIMAGVRTPTRQFSSCVLIKAGDSLDSLNASATAIVNYVSKRAGIGISAGAVRGIGSPIRNGEMVHTGIIPFLKYHVGALKSCSQGGIRGGNATVYYPMWHYQYDDIIVLKNNRGIEENRERRVDYGIEIDGEMIRRLLNNEDIWLLDPSEHQEMYESYYRDSERFAKLYAEACDMAMRGECRGKRMKASEIWDMALGERTETSRIYYAFVDNMNNQSPFDQTIHPIYQSNLCLEIALPTREFQHQFDEDGRIALCTLASFNMSAFVDGDLADMEKYAEALVCALDYLLDYQDYPMIQAKLATEEFRTLGIGVVNLADFLCRHGLKYGESKALKLLDEWMEKFMYSLTKASVRLAKQMGPCSKWKETIYAEGKFPFEYRRKGVDELVEHQPEMDWDALSEDIKKYGIRNATLSAIAPTESSSQVLNATNGVEMPKAPMSIKASKSGLFKQIVPSPELIGQYEYLWANKTPTEYLKTCAVLQKWVDQSISTNTFYNPLLTGDKIERQQMLYDIIMFYSLGGKTLYYQNINDGAGDELQPEDQSAICAGCIV